MAARVVGISGIGDEAVSPKHAALGWGIIIGTGVLIFVGTLLLRPKSERA